VGEISRYAVLTGGGGSLGAMLQQTLTNAGWNVAAPTRRELDVTRVSSVESWFHGKAVDLLICAAGCTDDSLATRLSEAQWDQVVRTNLKGAFLCSQAAAKNMTGAGKGGHIVLVSSAAAILGTLGQANYAAAKAGVIGLTKSLATEWGPLGIQVNCVLPGWLEPSKMTSQVSPQARAAALERQVLRKFNSPNLSLS
jgi:NAD(P)-dependent dehydrogenase (short-subunit alcohol dehydrogenase family)